MRWVFLYLLVADSAGDLMGLQKRASEGVEMLFSDALKEPMLRRIQFSTQTRVDYLGEYGSR